MTENQTPQSVGQVETQTLALDLPPEGLVLDGKGLLRELTVAYETYGELNEARSNVIFICHALSGDAHVAGVLADDSGVPGAGEASEDGAVGWWDEMVGPGKGIDTDYYHVVCANILGGCSGTTGPSSINPETGQPYGSTFPRISVGDIVTVHLMLLRQLGIKRVAAVIGGSFGGMQALEWAIRYPDTVGHCICIASASSLSTQALAFDVVARNAITSDPEWKGGDYYASGKGPRHGLAQARRIGHITYLSPGMMTRKFGRERREAQDRDESPFSSTFQVESYLDYKGKQFLERFDANSYLLIIQAMDSYDLDERWGSLEKAFKPIQAKLLVVALSEDWLFPPEQSLRIANALLRSGKHVSYCHLHAPHGHDAFLVDIEHLSETIRAFLPWVGMRLAHDAETPAQRHARKTSEDLYEFITDMIQPGSRVLDVGCGNGKLLTTLNDTQNVSGLGVDIDIHHVIQVIDRGHGVLQSDIDTGLAAIPDNSYDYVILSETLQVVHRPRFVLDELLRVAREVILSFPNFGHWSQRMQLLLRGRMPKGSTLPFEWYNTPNIHLFTRKDFIQLCRQDNVRIVDMVCLPSGGLDRTLLLMGCCNIGAAQVLVKVTRGSPATKTNSACCRTTQATVE